MMTLYSVGRYIETQFGSLPFLGLTFFLILFIGPLQIPLAMALEAITQNSISMRSTHQCGVGMYFVYDSRCTFYREFIAIELDEENKFIHFLFHFHGDQDSVESSLVISWCI